jgi:hypothetical protein
MKIDPDLEQKAKEFLSRYGIPLNDPLVDLAQLLQVARRDERDRCKRILLGIEESFEQGFDARYIADAFDDRNRT